MSRNSKRQSIKKGIGLQIPEIELDKRPKTHNKQSTRRINNFPQSLNNIQSAANLNTVRINPRQSNMAVSAQVDTEFAESIVPISSNQGL